MNPDETNNDIQFRQEEVNNFFDMSRIVVPSHKFYYVASESLFGNLYVENEDAEHFNCSIFLYYRNNKVFPSLNTHGVEEVFLTSFILIGMMKSL